MSASHAQRLPFCLLIDPSITMRKVIELTLHRANYPDCASFADPVEAMKAIARKDIAVPDIALVCWNLPRLDGIGVLRLMRYRRYHTTVIMLLDQGQDGLLVQAKAKIAGAQSTLTKPFTSQQLLSQLATIKCTY